jgi:putative SOS response-associated peptidase YedK
MCAQYQIKIRLRDLAADFPLDLPQGIEEISAVIFPGLQAPVVRAERVGLTLDFMQFGLVPHWSKERKPSFATYNARIETVLEKPAWKNCFVRNHVLVPLSGFLESAASGPFGGNMVEFYPELRPMLYAAGIFDIWRDLKSGEEIRSFAILTKEPSEFILQNGHDRCPIFLSGESARDWLRKPLPATASREWLLRVSDMPVLGARAQRPLRPKGSLHSRPFQPTLIAEPGEHQDSSGTHQPHGK